MSNTFFQASPAWMEAAQSMKFDAFLGHIIRGGVIGKKCWKVTVSYGELTLHMGRRLPYDNPRMAGEKKGEWIFCTCGTQWLLMTPQGVVQPSDGAEEVVEEKAESLEGSKLIEFGVTWPKGSAILTFNNGCRLFVTPTDKDLKYELPFWEFFTPENRVMSFGPDLRLSYRRSDV